MREFFFETDILDLRRSIFITKYYLGIQNLFFPTQNFFKKFCAGHMAIFRVHKRSQIQLVSFLNFSPNSTSLEFCFFMAYGTFLIALTLSVADGFLMWVFLLVTKTTLLLQGARSVLALNSWSAVTRFSPTAPSL